MRLQKAITGTFPIPNDPDKAEITVKHLTPGEIADIQEEMDLIDMRLREDEGGAMKREGVFNSPKGEKRYLWITKAVIDWKGIKDEDGKELPCTDEAKIAVARADDDFGTFVGECRDKLAAQVKEQKEKAAKN